MQGERGWAEIRCLVEQEEFGTALQLLLAGEAEQGAVPQQLLLAECLLRTGEARRAIELLERVRRQLEQAEEQAPRLLAHVNDLLGEAHRELAHMVQAHACYLRAYQSTLHLPRGEMLSAHISLHLAISCRWQERHGEAIVHGQFAHDFFQQAAERRWLVRTLLHLGQTHEQMGEPDECKRYLLRALSICQTERMPQALTVAVRQQYAFAVLGKQDMHHAVAELRQVAAAYQALCDAAGEAHVYAQIAELFLARREVAEAERALQAASALFTEEMAAKDPRLTDVYRVRARCLLISKAYRQAIVYADKATENFARMGLEKASNRALRLAATASRMLGNQESTKTTLEHVLDSLDW